MTERSDSPGTAAGTVRLDVEDDVTTLLIDRPAKLNALTPEMLDALDDALARVGSSSTKVVLLRGAGEKAFCVGADITRFSQLSPADMWGWWGPRGHEVFDRLACLRQPTVAVVQGLALGGGLELALACDFRVVAQEARLGFPEVGLGTIPGWGGTERLTELVGRARAKEIVLARRSLDGRAAMKLGMATRLAPMANLESAVAEFVGELTAGPATAVQLAKQLIDAAADGAPGRVLEPLASGLSAATDEFRKATAAFTRHRQAGTDPYDWKDYERSKEAQW